MHLKYRLLAVLYIVITYATAQNNIGHTTLNLVDNTRNRTIATEVYYPSDVAGDDVAVAMGNYPVLVFGHGFLMSWDAYSNFVDQLVPQGYILCFPTTEMSLSPSHQDFGSDLSFVASEMQALNSDNTSLFYNSVAPNTALMGHSMGGGASFLAAENNANIQAVVNFAAAETNPSAVAAASNVMVPTLLFSGSDDCVTPAGQHQNLMYANVGSACKTLISINDGVHCYFANNNFNCEFGEGLCNSSINITRATQQSITFAFLIPWLNYTLNNDESSGATFANTLETSTDISYLQSCEALKIDYVTRQTGIEFFPNPSNGIVNYNLMSSAIGGELKIYSIEGKLINQIKLSHPNGMLDLQDYKEGIYILNYATETKVYSYKLVKQ